MNRIKLYYNLTKPGIIYGNDMSAFAGFLLASGHHVAVIKLLVTLLGVSLAIGSGCVFNNYLDREIDKKMNRTKHRASALGLISLRTGMIYASILGVLGFVLLLCFINRTTAAIGLIGIVDYVILYGYTKRKSVYGTLVGSVAGATPPLAGYTAVTGHLDMAGILLFLILTVWQMPHFYAIAIFRLKDYGTAKLPVLPVKQGISVAKLHILFYIVTFIVVSSLLYFEGFTGIFYLIIMLGVGLWWLWAAFLGFRDGVDDTAWARGIFFRSLTVLTVFCAVVSIGALL